MHSSSRTSTRRAPGALQALCLTVLVLSLGLFGSGVGTEDVDQSPASGFSETFEPVVGAPSPTGLNALPNWLRSSVESSDDSDESSAAIGVPLSDYGYLSLPNAKYFPPVYLDSRYHSDHSPRAPPLV